MARLLPLRLLSFAANRDVADVPGTDLFDTVWQLRCLVNSQIELDRLAAGKLGRSCN